MNILEYGDNRVSRPALIFLHYFAGSSKAWVPVMELLQDRFYCLAPDLRGFGGTEAPTSGYTVSDYADDIAALTTSLGLTRYVVVGHSMGGKAALLLAARQASGLESLVLAAPSPPTPEPMEDDERERLLRGHSSRTEAEKTVRSITADTLPVPLFEQAVEDSLRTSQEAWDAWLTSGSREDISPQITQIAIPVLLVAGDRDSVMATDMLEREVLARLPEARMTILAGTGHLSPLEVPAALAELIAEAATAS